MPKSTDDLETENLPDVVRSEAQLDTIGYFEAGYKHRYPKQKRERRTLYFDRNRSISFIPTTYGYPNGLDLDYHRALEVLMSENTTMRDVFDQKSQQFKRRAKVKQPLRISTRRFIKLAGRTETGGERKHVSDYLARHTGTLVQGSLYSKKEDRTHRQSFNATLFEKTFRRGDELPDGRIADMNYIWLSSWYLSNFCTGYVKPTNIRLHHSLTRPYAKALVPLIDQGFFATDGRPWHKRYSTICERLSIPLRRKLSDIIRMQFGPSLDELKARAFIKSWKIIKTVDGKDFVIHASAGELWLQDHDKRPKNPALLPDLVKPKRGTTTLIFQSVEPNTVPQETILLDSPSDIRATIRSSFKEGQTHRDFLDELIAIIGNDDDRTDFGYMLKDRDCFYTADRAISAFRRWLSEIRQGEHDDLDRLNLAGKLRTLYKQDCHSLGILPYNERNQTSTATP